MFLVADKGARKLGEKCSCKPEPHLSTADMKTAIGDVETPIMESRETFRIDRSRG